MKKEAKKSDEKALRNAMTLAKRTKRMEHLRELSDTYGVEFHVVKQIAAMLGEEEDYDGLVSTIEDIAMQYEYKRIAEKKESSFKTRKEEHLYRVLSNYCVSTRK